ncbi:MT-A70 family methyltransferase [Mannheimia haemolytica]|nr:MT-A70 family methyltransferase [Mannheimia haemolytica]
MTDFDKNIKYKIIYADPPWKYKDSSCNGSAENHYTTMNIKEICDLPVQDISDKDSILFFEGKQ